MRTAHEIDRLMGLFPHEEAENDFHEKVTFFFRKQDNSSNIYKEEI